MALYLGAGTTTSIPVPTNDVQNGLPHAPVALYDQMPASSSDACPFQTELDWDRLFKFVQGNMDIFLVENAKGGLNRFTADAADDIFPIRSPDAADIVFSSTRNRSLDLYLKPASGIRSEELQTFPRFQYVVSSDGQRFLMQVDTEVALLAPITVILNWSGHSK